MKSGELAQLAGVTVRTLRHYRSIGLLPEPQRATNGYADYRLDDLVRILRIKQLSSLGFSLEHIGELLDHLDAQDQPHTGQHLDALDKQLALRIEELQAQRRTIALLKEHQLDADVPTRFAEVITLLREGGFPPSSTLWEKEAALLAEHVLDEASWGEVESIYRTIAERNLLNEYRIYNDCFDALEPNASPAKRDEAVAAGLAFLEPLVICCVPENWDRQSTDAERLLERLETEHLNDAQREVTQRLLAETEQRARQQLQNSPGTP